MRHRASILLMGIPLFLCTPALAAIKVKAVDLGHGVEAWVAKTTPVPVVDIVITFEGGGHASDPEGKAGRAAFVASMLTEGAGNLDSAAFRRALEDKAITLTAETDEDRLRIHLYMLRDHAKEAGELLAQALEKPLLAEGDQARMKADLTSYVARMNEWPSYRAARLMNERGFRNHPYSHTPYGDAASIAKLTTSDIRDYLKTYVTRSNMLIAAAGDVDDDMIEDMLDPVVDALTGNDTGAVTVAKTSLQGAGEVLRATIPSPQTTILFAAPAIARNDPRFYAEYLLNHILGGNGLTSRLADGLRQKKGLVYSVDSDVDVKLGAALIRGALETRNANTDTAIAEVKLVLSEIQSKGITAEECADAKSHAVGAFSRKLDSSGEVSNLLISMQVHKLGIDYIEKRAGYFNAVSCAEINAVASELLNPANFLFAVVGGAPEGEEGSVKKSASGHADTK